MHKKLAKIEDTFLGTEDHGLFTTILFVDYGGSGQGVGLYALDEWDEAKKRRVGTAKGLDFIKQTMWAVGADSWEKVKGRTIYVLTEDDSWTARVIGIESLPWEGSRQFIFDDLWNNETV